MKSKKAIRALAPLALLAATFAGLYGLHSLSSPQQKEAENDNAPQQYENYNGSLQAPAIQLPSANCALYARLATEQLFNKHYTHSHAWDRRYNDVLVAKVDNKSLKDFEASGILKPGMIIGMYNPKSTYNNWLDSKNKKVTYTHNVVYLGKDKGNLVFGHQFGTVRTQTLEQILHDGLVPREIIDSRN